MHQFTRSDIEVLSGVAFATINQWRKKFPQHFPIYKNERLERFSKEEAIRILQLCLLQQSGGQIENFTTADSKDFHLAIDYSEVSDTNQPANILKVLLPILQFNTTDVQNSLDEIAIKSSFEIAISKVVYPLQMRLKKLKLTGDTGDPYLVFF